MNRSTLIACSMIPAHVAPRFKGESHLLSDKTLYSFFKHIIIMYSTLRRSSRSDFFIHKDPGKTRKEEINKEGGYKKGRTQNGE